MFSRLNSKRPGASIWPLATVTVVTLFGTSLVVLADHKGNHKGGGGGSDTTAPDAVLDLVAEEGAFASISLTWTAVGDDGGGASCIGAGSATRYDVRFSVSPILDDGDFDVATPLDGEPVPSQCGFIESFCLINLEPGVTHYVALKVEDDSGNVSPLSNLAIGTPGSTLGVSVHVTDVLPQWSPIGRSRQRWAIVTLVDEFGVPVADATVTGVWSGCKGGASSGITDCRGIALLPGGKVSCNKICEIVFTVTDVTHDLFFYDASANVEDSDSQTCL